MVIFKMMAISLLCTIVIETTIGRLLGIKEKKDILMIILVNVLTNPLVNSISFNVLITKGILFKRLSMIVLEISAFVIEGFIYKRTLDNKKIGPYKLSLLLNVMSYTLGLIINKIVW